MNWRILLPPKVEDYPNDNVGHKRFMSAWEAWMVIFFGELILIAYVLWILLQAYRHYLL
jgi:hypothetical protein